MKKDTIIYTINTRPGGMDGMDPKAKGGVRAAFFSRREAEQKCDAWSDVVPYDVVPIVVDLDEMRANVLARLNPVERLALTREASRSQSTGQERKNAIVGAIKTLQELGAQVAHEPPNPACHRGQVVVTLSGSWDLKP